MDPNIKQVLDLFMSSVDKKLESVLDVNSRLMKENIELRRKLKENSVPSAAAAAIPPRPPFNSTPSTEKKKVIMEGAASGELRFRGNGTYDAKEIIKSMGNANFDSATKAWVLVPSKSIEIICESLKKDFDFQFIEN